MCCLHFFVQLLPQLCNNLISMSWRFTKALRFTKIYGWKGSPPASAFCSWHADRKPFSRCGCVDLRTNVDICWYGWKMLKESEENWRTKKKNGLLGFETLPAGFTIILNLGWSSWLVWLGIWMYSIRRTRLLSTLACSSCHPWQNKQCLRMETMNMWVHSAVNTRQITSR